MNDGEAYFFEAAFFDEIAKDGEIVSAQLRGVPLCGMGGPRGTETRI